MVKEVVCIHVGQAGVQMGQAIWELLCLEHNISLSGFYKQLKDDGSHITLNSRDLSCDSYTLPDGATAYFTQTHDDRATPRAIFIDFEPTVVDQVRTGRQKGLFDQDCLITGKEDSANNYARGRYTGGTIVIEQVLNSIIKVAESCDSLQGFMVFHSVGGGTGAGFQSLLVERLSNLFNKKGILDFAIYPSPKLCTSVVEPYNVVLNTSASLENTTCEFLADNQAMYNICQDKLGVECPTYFNMNKLFAHAFSAITLSQRSCGVLNAEFSDFQTNLVPFPRVHFPVIAFAPLVGQSTVSQEYLSIQELTRAVFDPSNRFVDCMRKNSKYMACCLLYRGDVAPKDINQVIWTLKERKTIEFVDWSPTGIKVGINFNQPLHLPESNLAPIKRALCMLANTSEIADTWSKLNYKYKLMSDKRAFYHWYLSEGMEMEEFQLAKDDLLTLERDYLEIECDFDSADSIDT